MLEEIRFDRAYASQGDSLLSGLAGALRVEHTRHSSAPVYGRDTLQSSSGG